MKFTQEGGGHVALCVCKWERWEAEKPVLERAARAHLKMCKKAAKS